MYMYVHIYTSYTHTHTIGGKPNSYKQWFMIWISTSHYFIFISRTIHFPNKVLCGIITYIMNKRRGTFLEIGRKSGGSWSLGAAEALPLGCPLTWQPQIHLWNKKRPWNNPKTSVVYHFTDNYRIAQFYLKSFIEIYHVPWNVPMWSV